MSRVTIATYLDPVVANLAKIYLHSHGIKAFVADEHLASMQPLYRFAIGGVRLQVEAEDEAVAKRILIKWQDATSNQDE